MWIEFNLYRFTLDRHTVNKVKKKRKKDRTNSFGELKMDVDLVFFFFISFYFFSSPTGDPNRDLQMKNTLVLDDKEELRVKKKT